MKEMIAQIATFYKTCSTEQQIYWDSEGGGSNAKAQDLFHPNVTATVVF